MAIRPEERTRTYNLSYIEGLVKVYRDAELNISTKISRKRKLGNVTRYQDLLLKDVQVEIDSLNKFTTNFAKQYGTSNYKAGANFIATYLTKRKLSTRGFDASSNLHTNAIELVVENMTNTLSSANNLLGRRIADDVREAGLRASALRLSARTNGKRN